MKKINWWNLVWVLGLFAILGIILFLVIEYKVKWEDIDNNKYLYFYDCNGNLCTSTTRVSSYYSKYMYKNNSPYVTSYNDLIAIINDNNKYIIYDYINNKVVDNNYDSVELDDGVLKVSSGNYYGLLDNDFNIHLNVEYQYIDVCKNNIIIKKDDRYSLLSLDKEEIGSNYLYIYSLDDNSYLTINNDNFIDIVDNNLNSNLIMTIEGKIDYSIVDNINSLNIRMEDNLVLFNVIDNDNSNVTYKYDLNSKKLV